eukprot:1195389-Prymnesium_polylepis.1
MPSPHPPVPPEPYPMLCPFTRICCDPVFVPHIATQFVPGVTYCRAMVRQEPYRAMPVLSTPSS